MKIWNDFGSESNRHKENTGIITTWNQPLNSNHNNKVKKYVKKVNILLHQ